MNVVILMGRMTRDPELKYTSGGKAYTSFTLAVQKMKDDAEFIDCIAWEKTAETIAEYFRKGRKILVQGRLNVSSYEQNGEKRKLYCADLCYKSVKSFLIKQRPSRAKLNYRILKVTSTFLTFAPSTSSNCSGLVTLPMRTYLYGVSIDL